MRILLISPTLPVPISGGRTRLYNLVKQLSVGHHLTLMAFLTPADDKYSGLLEPYCETVELIPIEDFRPDGKWGNRIRGWSQLMFSSRPGYVRTFPVGHMREPLRRLLEENEFDVVVFEQLFLVELFSELVDLPAVLIEQNVESDIVSRRMMQASNPVHRIRDRLIWKRLAEFEKHWLAQFPVSVAVSPRDAEIISDFAPDQIVIVVPNGVDSDYFAAKSDDREPSTVLFFGSLSYEPNIDGLLWFCTEIWPDIHAALPSAVFDIVGLRSGPRISALADIPGVRLTGFVEDIRLKLWSSTITVVPLRRGGGTRLKILEAMAAGCPIISTTIGAEGLAVEDGIHLDIADSQRSFVDKTLALLQSPQRRLDQANAGRDLVEKEYDWAVLAPRLEDALDKAIEIHGEASAQRSFH